MTLCPYNTLLLGTVRNVEALEVPYRISDLVCRQQAVKWITNQLLKHTNRNLPGRSSHIGEFFPNFRWFTKYSEADRFLTGIELCDGYRSWRNDIFGFVKFSVSVSISAFE